MATSSRELTDETQSGSEVGAGFRTILYPTWKLSDHWILTGAFQFYSQPESYGSSSGYGRGMKGNVLQANLGYSQFWRDGSIVVRAGELTTAFGSYLRYDDAANPLIGLPIEYGYRSAPVSIAGLAGIQADISQRNWDARAQFVNSSPKNPRSILQSEQYGSWAAGLGYTIRQGFRIGVSTYRGAYLDRQSHDYSPGEGRPRDLPARAYGLDVQWARGHWNVQGELQDFLMTHRAVLSERNRAGYVDVQRVLHPRWYVAARYGFSNSNADGNLQRLEAVVGFRPATRQIIKIGYEFEHAGPGEYYSSSGFSVQYVATIHPLSFARN
ncbi:MAG: hypothetical protein M3Y07_13595 [Acidobacteriota bacterium]|nr:hypothetical protein [Acidobacteriota bacterium]